MPGRTHFLMCVHPPFLRVSVGPAFPGTAVARHHRIVTAGRSRSAIWGPPFFINCCGVCGRFPKPRPEITPTITKNPHPPHVCIITVGVSTGVDLIVMGMLCVFFLFLFSLFCFCLFVVLTVSFGMHYFSRLAVTIHVISCPICRTPTHSSAPSANIS